MQTHTHIYIYTYTHKHTHIHTSQVIPLDRFRHSAHDEGSVFVVTTPKQRQKRMNNTVGRGRGRRRGRGKGRGRGRRRRGRRGGWSCFERDVHIRQSILDSNEEKAILIFLNIFLTSLEIKRQSKMARH